MRDFQTRTGQTGPLPPPEWAPPQYRAAIDNTRVDMRLTASGLGRDRQVTTRRPEHPVSGASLSFPDVTPTVPDNGVPPVPGFGLRLLKQLSPDMLRVNPLFRLASATAKAGGTILTPHKAITLSELQALGKKADKKAFFAVMLEGALASEKQYGIPASVILAQAALESGWGKSAIGGFNLFGIKGRGPAGSVQCLTKEEVRGRKVLVKASFAKFHTLAEGIAYHGKVFTNPAYAKAVETFGKTKDTNRFVRDIAGTYATDSNYASLIQSLIKQHGLEALCQAKGAH